MPESHSLSLIVVVRHLDAGFNAFLTAVSPCARDIQCVFVAVGPFVTESAVARAAADHAMTGVLTLAAAEVASARRAGLSIADAAWVAFPNPSDTFTDDAFTSILSAARAAPADVDFLVLSSGSRTRNRRASRGGAAPSDIAHMVFRRGAVPPTGAAATSGTDALLVFDLLTARHAPVSGRIVRGVYRSVQRIQPAADAQTAWFRRNDDAYDRLIAEVSRRLDTASRDVWQHRLLARELVTLARLETHQATCAVFDTEHGEHFVGRLGDVLRRLPDEAFGTPKVAQVNVQALSLIAALRGEAARLPARVEEVDVREQIMRVTVPGFLPSDVVVRRGGGVVDGTARKRKSVKAFGVVVSYETAVWVPASGDVSLTVAGQRIDIRVPGAGALPSRLRAGLVARALRRGRRHAANARDGLFARTRSLLGRAAQSARQSWLSRAAAVRLVAHLPFIGGRFRNAWMLMDRADMAGDNAEHLYRWLVENHPELNLWFVLRRDVPDYQRLAAEGFRLIGYRTLSHHLLLHRAKIYLSSHVGVAVSRPIFDRYLIDSPPWSFVFLQHGVIHNDLSSWLNKQRMRLCVATTHKEREALAGDGSPYVLTEREVRLTGMPRLDRLRRLADAAPLSGRRSIIIAPTWRNGLLSRAPSPGAARQPNHGATQSPFQRMMDELLAHPKLKELVDQGFSVTLVPHPNIAPLFPGSALPPHIGIAHYGKDDVQALLADARVVLTDYSSVAFDAAFAGAAVVYLQPEDAGIYGPAHTVARGDFNFEQDGFGPVSRTVDEALEAVVAAVRFGAATRFVERAQSAFGHWDDGACVRLFDTLLKIGVTPTLAPYRLRGGAMSRTVQAQRYGE